MHLDSFFNIKIDFDKSHHSYIYDKTRKKYFLDFFGLYASLPLGYNHPIFKTKSFLKDYNRTASVKIPNCEIISSQAQTFLKLFSSHPAMKGFKHFHFCCSGGLAVEAAIKVAIDHNQAKNQVKNPKIIGLKQSFHGITGYSSFVTDKFSPINKKLDGYPRLNWHHLHNPKIIYKNSKPNLQATQAGLKRFKQQFMALIKKQKRNLAALIIEPIQSTFGDNHFPKSFFQLVRKLCTQYQICLIFDEIQTGFGTTGKMWYFQHLGIKPDIVVFGKKAQIAGIMASQSLAYTFQHPARLEVTFDGDLTDMIRSSYTLKAYQKYHLLKNAQKKGRQLLKGLKQIKGVHNPRGQGLIIAFDLATSLKQDQFAQIAFKNGLLFNKTRTKTIRLRPNLNLSSKEIQTALAIIKQSV